MVTSMTMTRKNGWSRARVWLAGFAILLMPACDDLLAVDDPVNLTPDDLAGAAPVSLTVNGVRGSFQSMFDYYVLHTGLLADEFVAAGTFPYRAEFDDRNIDINNDGLRDNVYTPLSVARFMADTAVVILSEARQQAGVDQDQVAEGIAFAEYFGGYTRMLLAEGFCVSPIAGGPALSSDERMRDALAMFQKAEASALAAGQPDLIAAARLGQARAHLWLREFPQAAAAAGQVPASFEFASYYSNASIPQKNKVARFTWAIDEVIRWTVGDGSVDFLAFERWPYYDEWVELGLIEARPDLSSFNPPVPVHLQQKYTTGNAPIVIASTTEAQLIIAEAHVRAGELPQAAAIVNALRADNWSLPALTFTGNLQDDLRTMARERARELWITGERLATLRRLLVDGIDLFPTGKNGNDTCMPLPRRESDTNPNL